MVQVVARPGKRYFFPGTAVKFQLRIKGQIHFRCRSGTPNMQNTAFLPILNLSARYQIQKGVPGVAGSSDNGGLDMLTAFYHNTRDLPPGNLHFADFGFGSNFNPLRLSRFFKGGDQGPGAAFNAVSGGTLPQ